ncbi:MAG: SDR family NAD(P)-dependent oxidoreductase [bacterium]|nr:SDR family NAD(P)-dependent oxidoreductase [bacterium]
MDIQNITAIVSGGASGLGEASVRQLVAGGAKVGILDMDAEKGEKLAAELGDSVLFFQTNITEEEPVTTAIDKTCEKFGTIHAVINCAGISDPVKVIGKKGIMPMEKFNRVVNVNLMGTMNVIRLAAAKLFENAPNDQGERGVIINTASIAAFEGQLGQAAYAASKAAIVGLTLPLAREFADIGIRVVTIAPGLFKTPMMEGLPEKVQTALGEMVPFPRRLGHPVEFANMAMEIVRNPMINGETIRLDAALRMSGK